MPLTISLNRCRVASTSAASRSVSRRDSVRCACRWARRKLATPTTSEASRPMTRMRAGWAVRRVESNSGVGHSRTFQARSATGTWRSSTTVDDGGGQVLAGVRAVSRRGRRGRRFPGSSRARRGRRGRASRPPARSCPRRSPPPCSSRRIGTTTVNACCPPGSSKLPVAAGTREASALANTGVARNRRVTRAPSSGIAAGTRPCGSVTAIDSKPGHFRLHAPDEERQFAAVVLAGGREHEIADVPERVDPRRHEVLELEQHIVLLPGRLGFQQQALRSYGSR